MLETTSRKRTLQRISLPTKKWKTLQINCTPTKILKQICKRNLSKFSSIPLGTLVRNCSTHQKQDRNETLGYMGCQGMDGT